MGDSNHGVVRLRTWNPRRASEPYVLRQTTNVAEDGVATSGYGTEYARQIRAVGYCPVGDEVIPSNAENVFGMSCGMLAACVSLPSTASRFQHHEGLLPGHM